MEFRIRHRGRARHGRDRPHDPPRPGARGPPGRV